MESHRLITWKNAVRGQTCPHHFCGDKEREKREKSKGAVPMKMGAKWFVLALWDDGDGERPAGQPTLLERDAEGRRQSGV